MTYATHIAGAAAACLMLDIVTSDISADNCIAIAACVTGSLLPDIDHRQSKISKSNLGTGIIAWMVSILSHHRGVLHTPFFIAVMVIPLYYGNMINNYTIAFLVSYASHIALDTLNQGGIMLLYPLSEKRVRFFIHTRGFFEAIVCAALILICVSKLKGVV